MKFSKFLKALRLDSCRVSVLLSASESSLMLLVLQMAWSPPKCLRKASIYRSLGVGERHVAESDW